MARMDIQEREEGAESLEIPTSAEKKPDVMNDPKYNLNVKGREKDGDDVDTCRICRGEGLQEEPLFYPCKCSGSIQFVHQSCLMEWLAHSQKKHCELCKTPFRFTKLYHPQMPSTVPLPVFLRQATIHGWTTLMVWARFQLVLFVWVFWLPWCMRTIWRGLFWVGDGAWVDWDERGLQHRQNLPINQPDLPGNATTPRDIYLFGSKNAAASAFVDYFSNKVTKSLVSYSFESGPVGLSLATRFWRSAFGQSSATNVSFPHPENATSIAGVLPRSSTWLSDLPFLNSMTRSTTVNNIIVDTLEGQLITLFVVVAFILIFLIREWVMQQQQNLLLGPGDNQEAVGPNMDAPEQQDDALGAAEQRPEQAGPGGNEIDEVENDNDARRPGARLFIRPRRRLNRRPPQPAEDQVVDLLAEPAREEPDQDEPETHAEDPSRLVEAQDASTDPVPLVLPPRRNARGELVYPPPELEELNLSSAVWRDVLERTQHNPKEMIRNVHRELPEFERDNIMQLLATPASIAYYSASLDLPLDITATGVSDKKDEGSGQRDLKGDHAEDDEEDFEFLGAPTPESGHSATSKQSLVDATNMNGSAQEAREPRLPSISLQDLPSLVPGNGSRDLEPDLVANSTLHRMLDDEEQNDVADHDEALPNHSTGIGEVDANINVPEPTENVPAPTASVVQGNENTNDETTGNATEGSPPNQGVIEAIKNWLWGGVTLPAEVVEQQAGDDERVVDDIADEAPFVPIAHGHHLLQPANDAGNPAQDPEVLAAAAQAGIDPNEAEAVDEIEDLEGVMELIGMEGPLAGLMQNGMFCAVLVSLTIFFGVWIPYMSGKVFLTLLASPIALPVKSLRLASTSADMVVDFIIFVLGCSLYWVDNIANILCAPVGWFVPTLKYWTDSSSVAQGARDYAEHALERLAKASLTTGNSFTDGIDVPTFSAIAHESLRQIEAQLATISQTVLGSYGSLVDSLLQCSSFSEGIRFLLICTATKAKDSVSYVVEKLLTLIGAAPALLHINPLKFNLAGSHRSIPLDFDLAAWDTKDRAIAIASGYVFFALLGMLYLNVAGFLRGRNSKGAVNGTLAQILYQAGGVMKVILIISIEMIVFPLYCGLLLDVALLPLFGDVTFMSRVDFTMTSPWTSVFVHWFVGTCYMFHFALFVSMCRKIMRTGVLCMSPIQRPASVAANGLQTSFGILMIQHSILSVTFLSEAFLVNYGRSRLVHWCTGV